MSVTINISEGEVEQPRQTKNARVQKPRVVRPGRVVSTPAPVRPAAAGSQPQAGRTAFPIASRQQVVSTASQPKRVAISRPSKRRQVATTVLKSATPWGAARMGVKFGKKNGKKLRRKW